ncbi:extracellular solute-binding protein [Chelatococcus sp. SYSU_G07232]|uniref:Extracellular solute-binding protein n=1 Tax=Chelatococcus albus TaxID=3047466 RepID=A0ABT7AE06_9HYPH|nr:extracellular solute-binding protein [Chelatococcus sp. SYSU_G07232]MDJ1157622.1 extracellular solute-binding protein [Chelatococcus sp. SYSU_G07232]
MRLALAAAILAAGTAVVGSAVAQTPNGKLVVVTSFSKDVTDPFKKAFEKAYPGLTVEMQNRNTNAAVKYLDETKGNNTTDLFWASAPDAFEALKGRGRLEKYKPQATGIPEKIGDYPVNDPDGHYLGFAASGYGIMWNTRYVAAHKLPEPKDWSDLAKPAYFDHVAIAAPSRSGTTHLTLEAILQGEGWARGWRTLKEIGGNLREVTERSFGVPDGVNSGQFGYGIVIDFFGFSAQGAGFPVKFVYPTVTTIVPANIAIVKDAPNTPAAKAFVEFLLSPQGQEILFAPSIRRLPVNPEVYAKAPEGMPNPFKFKWSGGGGFKFNSDLSESRGAVVDALYDQLVTFQLAALKKATKAIHDAEARLAAGPNEQAGALIAEARELIAAMPITDTQAVASDIAAAFKGGSGRDKAPRQAEFEQAWGKFAADNYAKALAKAEEAAKLLK